MGKESKYEPIIFEYSQKYNVNPALIKGIIRQESSWDEDARGDFGKALGLMQIHLTTAQEVSGMGKALTSEVLMRPKTNINLGTKYLLKQLDRYEGDVDSAIAAYNAGTAFKREDGSFTNQSYVNKIKKYMAQYGAGQQVDTSFSVQDLKVPVPPTVIAVYVGAAVLAYMLLGKKGGGQATI